VGRKTRPWHHPPCLWFNIPPGSSRECSHRIPTLISPVCNFSSSVTVWCCSRPRWFYFNTCDILLHSSAWLSTSPLLGSAELWEGRLRDASGVKVISLWKLSRGRAVRCAYAIEAIVRRDETVSVGVTHLGLLKQTSSKHVDLANVTPHPSFLQAERIRLFRRTLVREAILVYVISWGCVQGKRGFKKTSTS